MSALALLLVLADAPAPVAPAPAAPTGPASAPAAAADPPAPAKRYSRPDEAYAAGAYDQALQGFVDAQVERPDDASVALNVGAAHYKMRNWDEAEKAFGQAALRGDPALRAQALYNLGNVAFRQGKLDQAIARYQDALAIAPDDEDAKYNLELVRNEIRRRHEEAKKRQEQQQQQQGNEGDQGQQGQQGEQPPQEPSPGQGAEQDTPQAGPDTDQDGLPDATEQHGKNPTDPRKADSDGDGLKDGEEDRNRNGALDAGETDPNKADSDGDGVPDGKDAQPTGSQAAAAGQSRDGAPGEMSKEEAERYLKALEEHPPEHRPPGRRGRAAPAGKDW